MILIRKLTPQRLTKAIVVLAVRSGNRVMRTMNNNQTPRAARGEEFSRAVDNCGGRVKLNKRTTITVETERLVIVTHERAAPKEPDVYSPYEE